MNNKIFLLFFAIILVFFSGCNPHVHEFGKVILKFEFHVDGEEVVLDELRYTNEAGNLYMINDIQMILSMVELTRSDGGTTGIGNAYYLDFADESTHTWTLDFNGGIYKSIGFTFGLTENTNVSGKFTDPPMSDMFWPETLGGGYHYMKLNCKWQQPATKNSLQPFNLHLGKVPIYISEDYSSTPIAFLDNYFEVKKDINFEINENDNIFIVSVNLNNWFNSPNVIDFDQYVGVSIMQNTTIQVIAARNGENVFDIELQKPEPIDE